MILSVHSWEAPRLVLPQRHLFSSSSCELCSVVALLLRRREWSPGGLPASAEVSQLAYGGTKTPTRAVGFQGMCGRNVGGSETWAGLEDLFAAETRPRSFCLQHLVREGAPAHTWQRCKPTSSLNVEVGP